MKVFYIKKPSSSAIFTRAIREKQDIVLLLTNVIALFNSYSLKKLTTKKEESDIWIVVDKMSRCFLKNEEKIHTFQVPFIIEESDGYLSFFYNAEKVDSKKCAIFESLICSLNIQTFEGAFDSFLDILSMEFEIEDQEEIDFIWNAFLELMQFESGYMRYDHDLNVIDEYKHPEHHIDFNYSSNATFKLGLRKALNTEGLKRIVDINDACYYIDFS